MKKSASLASTMLVTFVIAFGISGLWFTAANWCLNMLSRTMQGGITGDEISLTRDGEPLVVSSGYDRFSRATTEQMLTLTGQPKTVRPTDLCSANYIDGIQS